MNITIISAVLPVVILLFFIYRKDKLQPEPMGKLIWTFFVGCLSVVPASMMELLLSIFTPSDSVAGGLFTGYVVAGFSEELCKLLLLLWVIWKSHHFDEYFDGIVYAVFLSLGFACVENIMYVVSNDDPMMVATTRGLLAVPAHFLFAVIFTGDD
jgi:RsiW-degrading membrane proteinase PrsW (M82 family)